MYIFPLAKDIIGMIDVMYPDKKDKKTKKTKA